jgi:wyosine [tRNA(Phe)-imidazoG37] synthetase (radical SAM superfamily)
MGFATEMENLIFGIVPSRRLGKSMGVNNIPHKVCSYSCAYCQIGKVLKMQVKRTVFYPTDLIVRQLEKKLNGLFAKDLPDYITLVPDGEPTLDLHLGELITKIKPFGFPVAVITNSSLLDDKNIQAELMKADYISLKVDTVNQASWKMINKPHKKLNLESILTAIQDFSKIFNGKLVTETMLIRGVNDSEAELAALAHHLKNIKPDIAYLAIPTRPPAFAGTFASDEENVAQAYEIFNQHGLPTELLTGYEGNDFASTGNFTDDLLSITAVHPMRKDAVFELMERSEATENDFNKLIENGLIKKIVFQDKEFYLRKFH